MVLTRRYPHPKAGVIALTSVRFTKGIQGTPQGETSSAQTLYHRKLVKSGRFPVCCLADGDMYQSLAESDGA